MMSHSEYMKVSWRSQWLNPWLFSPRYIASSRSHICHERNGSSSTVAGAGVSLSKYPPGTGWMAMSFGRPLG